MERGERKGHGESQEKVRWERKNEGWEVRMKGRGRESVGGGKKKLEMRKMEKVKIR